MGFLVVSVSYKINNYGRTNNSFGLTSGGDLWWIGGNVNSTIATKFLQTRRQN